MLTKTNEFREDVTAAILKMLEQGTAPWQKPWDSNGTDMLPYNPTTEKRYRGGNSMWLQTRGHSDPRWMTYKQAQENGWQVRKGEKGTHVEYWKFYDERTATDAAGKPITGPDGESRKVRAELERPRVFFATVFNASQIDGLPPLERKARVYEWDPEAHAESILRGSGARIYHDQTDKAYYNRSTDDIHRPLKDQFIDASSYFCTALH
jgi:antirestriction protein ArdC